MQPHQFLAIYDQLLRDATQNPNHRLHHLGEIAEAGPIESILYLPLYSMGIAAHVIEPRIAYLKNRAAEDHLNFFAASSLDELEQICAEYLPGGVQFGDFFERLYSIRRRAKNILELGVGQVENFLVSPDDVPTPERFSEVLNYLMDFHGVGDKAAQHILMDLGWPFVKPDRHIQRILCRLGGWNDLFVADNGNNNLPPEDWYNFQSRWIESVTNIINFNYAPPEPHALHGVPTPNNLNSRKIDLCLMWFSQTRRAGDDTLGAPVCTANPNCHECAVRPHCERGQIQMGF